MKQLIWVLMFVLLGGPIAHAGIELSAVKPIVVIRVDGQGRAAYAPRHLKRHLEKITASTIRVLKHVPEEPCVQIHVGRTPWVQETLGERLDGLPSHESYIIKTDGDRIALAGRGGDGTLSAAIEFLRGHCGVEMYLPGDIGTVYTAPTPLVLGDIDEENTPAFRHRLMYSPPRNKREAQAIRDWFDFHHRANAYEFSHNLWKLLRQSKYSKTNPEYFSYVDGRRRLFAKDGGHQWQPCMTNEKGIAIVADEVIRIFDAEPDRLSVSIGVNDGGNYCECENCKPLWRTDGSKFGECSVLFYTYANRIAERVAKKHPDKLLGCLAYSSTGNPPDGLDLHPMIMPFSTIMTQAATDSDSWAKVSGQIDEISRNARQFGLYDYLHGNGMYIPYVFDHAIARSIRYAYERGCRAMYFETGQQNWGLDGCKNALAMRLLWDPTTDVTAYREKFLRDFYGDAADAMRRYYAACEKAWARVPHVGVLHKRAEQMELFNEPLLQECEAALAEAVKVADTDIAAQRVLMVQRAFATSATVVRRYIAGKAANALLDQNANASEVIATLASVAGPSFDYDLLYASGPGRDLMVTIQPPGDGSVRMAAMFTKARSRLYSRVLNDVARAVVDSPRTNSAQLVVSRVNELFAAAPAGQGSDAMKAEALSVASRIAVAPRTQTALEVDGLLDDTSWQNAAVLDRFIAYGKGGPSRFDTLVRVCRDETNLYLAFDCRQPMDSLWCAAGMRDGSVWTDDSVELFFNLPGETNEKHYLQLIVNAKGQIFDMKNGSTHWNGDFAVATHLGDDGWTMEMALPLAMLGDYFADGVSRINIARNRQKLRGNKWWDYEEISSWFPSFEHHKALGSRGWLILR